MCSIYRVYCPCICLSCVCLIKWIICLQSTTLEGRSSSFSLPEVQTSLVPAKHVLSKESALQWSDNETFCGNYKKPTFAQTETDLWKIIARLSSPIKCYWIHPLTDFSLSWVATIKEISDRQDVVESWYHVPKKKHVYLAVTSTYHCAATDQTVPACWS